jgi:hypothetical protein
MPHNFGFTFQLGKPHGRSGCYAPEKAKLQIAAVLT